MLFYLLFKRVLLYVRGIKKYHTNVVNLLIFVVFCLYINVNDKNVLDMKKEEIYGIANKEVKEKMIAEFCKLLEDGVCCGWVEFHEDYIGVIRTKLNDIYASNIGVECGVKEKMIDKCCKLLEDCVCCDWVEFREDYIGEIRKKLEE